MASESDQHAISSRKALKVAVSALCLEVGFQTAEESVIETLTEMLESFLMELGRSTQAFAELAGRTEGIMTDVIMALIEMGQNIHALPGHAKRPNKTVFLPPAHSAPHPNIKMLQTGDRREHPSHIPDYLPPFPDPHTYIKTSTKKAPMSEYQMIREKAASQKRDVERALTRFIAKTGETQSLFRDDTTTYPLIAVKPMPLPYLNALLPKDQDLDSQDQPETMAVKKRKRAPEQSEAIGENPQGVDADSIDNPYLRPMKIAKYKKRLK
ncbi:transcription initiation factor TFIID subunit 8-like [Mytilus californianus]|uniref:transcription initiation factor TFIID subunit 8-like n=1 Tax=Mytilus californianus TaxID=6549 RepID=UPI0022450171|nr:transcription initiation factor TFIID subunit 8-like [Mytilus californianus]